MERDSKEEIELCIEENKKKIEAAKLEMAMMVSGRVQDLIQPRDCEGNDVDIPMVVRWKLEELWSRIEMALYENWKLESSDDITCDDPDILDFHIADSRQLKLDFDASIEESSDPDINSHGLGSLKDPVSNRYV